MVLLQPLQPRPRVRDFLVLVGLPMPECLSYGLRMPLDMRSGLLNPLNPSLLGPLSPPALILLGPPTPPTSPCWGRRPLWPPLRA